MRIKVIVEPVIIRLCQRMWRVVNFEAHQAIDLPDAYLQQAPYCYLTSEARPCLRIFAEGHQSTIAVDMLVSEEWMETFLADLSECAKRLHKIVQAEKDANKKWLAGGKQVYVI